MLISYYDNRNNRLSIRDASEIYLVRGDYIGAVIKDDGMDRDLLFQVPNARQRMRDAFAAGKLDLCADTMFADICHGWKADDSDQGDIIDAIPKHKRFRKLLCGAYTDFPK